MSYFYHQLAPQPPANVCPHKLRILHRQSWQIFQGTIGPSQPSSILHPEWVKRRTYHHGPGNCHLHVSAFPPPQPADFDCMSLSNTILPLKFFHSIFSISFILISLPFYVGGLIYIACLIAWSMTRLLLHKRWLPRVMGLTHDVIRLHVGL